MRSSIALATALLLALPLAAAEAPLYKNHAAPVEARVDDLLGRLTQDEKLALIGGDHDFFIRGVPRLGVPSIRMADGPQGVRDPGPSTAYPSTVALAASFDPALARQFGASMAHDARSHGVGILLGPGVNIQRVSVNGRNFEYFSEDPFLAGAVAAQEVQGMQHEGVVATVKHFAANNQETERGTIDVRVSERALQEIYLPAFRAAVQQGGAWAVMDAYNRLNGTYCTANAWLNQKVLKDDWGFKGVVMSDWEATHETLGPATAGLDLEMPSDKYLNAAALEPLLASGQVTQASIDDKVRRIIRLEIANGFLDRAPDAFAPKDDPKAAAVALQIAREGLVLLKNDDRVLPLSIHRTKSIVVLGPNADVFVTGGGSGHVSPFHTVSLSEGLSKAAPKATVEVMPDLGFPLLSRWARDCTYEGALSLQFATGDWRSRTVVATLTDARIDHNWTQDPAPGVALKSYWAQWKGTIRAKEGGPHTFLVSAHGNIGINLDGHSIISSWFTSGGVLSAEAELEAGRTYAIEVNVHHDGIGSPAVRFGWGPTPPLLSPSEEARVGKADAAVVCVGFNEMTEGEGADRPFDLPARQVALIRRVASLNKRTIVVLNSGGPVGTEEWIGDVPALIEAWYPGQEGGRAVAEALMGVVNPAGRLPVTFPRHREDEPSFGHYPGSNGTVDYAEDILVGYRWYDAKGVAPRFPFGFGLSYATFAYTNLRVEQPDAAHVTLLFDITNTGARDGDEVAQVYVSAPVPSRVKRPVRELKGLARVHIAADKTATVQVTLDRSAFAYYDTAKGDWVVEPGAYTVAVGSGSRSLELTHEVTLP